MPRPGDMKNSGALLDFHPSIHPQAVAGSSGINGDVVDGVDATSLTLVVGQGTLATGTDSAFYLEQSADGSTDFTKVEGSDLLLEAADSQKVAHINLEVGEGHYRAVYDETASDGDTEVYANIVLGGLIEGVPTSDDA